MKGIARRLVGCALLTASGLVLGAPEAVLAQQGGDGFLFRQPRVTVKFESGYGILNARSDVFDFTIDQLTVGRRDFDSPYVGGELAVRVTERWDAALGVGFQSSSVKSEFRDWVDLDNLPIEQVTDLQLIPLVVSARYYLRERGRQIGRFAWIPNGFAPFVGAGIGVVSYSFEQNGDFVDFQTFDVFTDRLHTEGDAFLARASGGVNLSLNKQFVLTAEARYTLASAEPANDFSDFDKMDLGGFQLVGGISIRF